MRRIVILLLTIAFVFSLAGMAAAQSSKSDQSGAQQSGTSQQYGSSKVQGKSMEDQRASKWIGSKIENRQGENLGKVEDLVLDSKGRVDFVIISHAGALGLGEKYMAVPLKSFSRKDGNTLVLDMSKEKMAQAPSFDKNNWPDMSNRQWSQNVYRYYGQKPSWSESSQGSKMQQPSRTEQKKNKME